MTPAPSNEERTQFSQGTPPLSSDASKRARLSPRFPVMTLLGLALMVGSLAAGVSLISLPQDIRNQAFTGFSARLGGNSVETTEPLRFAEPDEIPQSSQFQAEEGHRSAFYMYAEKYAHARPEYQEVPLPEFLLYGQVFLQQEDSPSISTLFARVTGFPEESLGESARLWLEMKDGTYRLLGTVDIETEDGRTVAYATYTGPGSLKNDAVTLHFSYDTAESDATLEPGFILLSVKM